METRSVVSFSESAIRFDEASEVDWPSGVTIYPALIGRVEGDLSVTHHTNGVASYPVTFTVDPGSEIYEPSEPTKYVGYRELFDMPFNWGSNVELTWSNPREIIDYGFGRIGQFIPYDFPTRIAKLNFLRSSYPETTWALDFFLRQRGRALEFMNAHFEDEIPYSAITGGGYGILVEGTEFGETYKDSTVFKRIAIRLKGGEPIYPHVDYVEVLPETDSSVIWLRDQLPLQELSPATVNSISWVLATRFATDKLVIEWLTDEVSRFSMTFQSLENYEI